MNNNDLMNALSGLDQKYIDEAAFELHGNPAQKKNDKPVRNKTNVKRILYFTIPAVAAALLAVGVALPVMIRISQSGSTSMATSDSAAAPAPEDAMYAPSAYEAAESAEPQGTYEAAESAEEPMYEEAEAAEEPMYEAAESAEEPMYEETEAAEAAGEAPAYNAAGEEAGIIDDEEAYSDAAKQADKSATVAGDKAADKAADGATASTAGVLGLEKATYDEGALTIEMRETLPADADEMVYTIKTKDAKGRETTCAEGILKDMITKKDPLTLDIGDLDLSDGTYILTIGTDSIEFTVQ